MTLLPVEASTGLLFEKEGSKRVIEATVAPSSLVAGRLSQRWPDGEEGGEGMSGVSESVQTAAKRYRI